MLNLPFEVRRQISRFFLETQLHQDFRFVGSCRPHWQFLSYEKKGTKDSQGTFWFLDLQQKGESPFDPPGTSPRSHFVTLSLIIRNKI